MVRGYQHIIKGGRGHAAPWGLDPSAMLAYCWLMIFACCMYAFWLFLSSRLLKIINSLFFITLFYELYTIFFL